MKYSLIIAAVAVLCLAAAESALAAGCGSSGGASCGKKSCGTKCSCVRQGSRACRDGLCGSSCKTRSCGKGRSCGNDCGSGACGSGGSGDCCKSGKCGKGACCGLCGGQNTFGFNGRCMRCGAHSGYCRGGGCFGRGCGCNDCGRRYQSHSHGTNGPGCWHNGYAYTPWGVPAALVVPPTADFVTNWGWGVGNTRVDRLYPQFGPNFPGYAEMEEGPNGEKPRYQFTPKQPSDTTQFGVNYIRGPW
jgi:hypothetical protein